MDMGFVEIASVPQSRLALRRRKPNLEHIPGFITLVYATAVPKTMVKYDQRASRAIDMLLPQHVLVAADGGLADLA